MIQYLTTIAYKIINLTFALRQIWLKTKSVIEVWLKINQYCKISSDF